VPSSRLEKFEALTKSALNVVLIFGAVAGGLWAFSQFWLTREMPRSLLELEELELRVEELEREQREAWETRVFEATLDARQAQLGGEGGCAIVGDVGFRNRTAAPIRLDYGEVAPLMVGRAAVDDGRFTFQDVALHPFALPDHPGTSYGPNDELAVDVGTVTAPPGRPLAIPFLIPVPRPGLYMVLLRPGISERWQAGRPGAAAPIDSPVWPYAVLVEVEAGRGCA
jgi:hypothetical protein